MNKTGNWIDKLLNPKDWKFNFSPDPKYRTNTLSLGSERCYRCKKDVHTTMEVKLIASEDMINLYCSDCLRIVRKQQKIQKILE